MDSGKPKSKGGRQQGKSKRGKGNKHKPTPQAPQQRSEGTEQTSGVKPTPNTDVAKPVVEEPQGSTTTATTEQTQTDVPLLDRVSAGHRSSRYVPEADQSDPSNWMDVSDLLVKSAEEMELGEMLHIRDFDLHEAMSAVDMMDAKMDPGFKASTILTYDERIMLGLLPSSSTLTEIEVLGIMDKLLACEVAWYDGQPLTHTVYTCLYLHNIDKVTHPWLGPYIKLLIKTIDMIRKFVIDAAVYEEEDFSCSLPGFGVLDIVTPDVGAKIAMDSVNDLTNFIKELAPNHANKPILDAILSRLKLRKAIFLAYKSVTTNTFGEAYKQIKQAFDLLPSIKQTCNIGQTIPDGTFEPQIAKRLPMPVPVRHITLGSSEGAVDFLTRQISDILKINSIPSVINFQGLLHFACQLSQTNPGIIPRSWLLHTVACRDQVYSRTKMQFARDTVLALPTPPSRVNNPKSDTYFYDVDALWCETMRVMLFNQARQRRQLLGLASKWEECQNKALILETTLSPVEAKPARYLLFYLVQVKLQVLVRYLLLGFPLELYEPHEYLMIYWYADYLFDFHLMQYTECRNRAVSDTKEERSEKINKKNKGNKKKKPSKVKPPNLTMLYLTLCLHTTRGIFRFLAALKTAHILSDRPFPFGSEQSRFEQRFHVFSKFSYPPRIEYSQFCKTANYSAYSTHLTHHNANVTDITQIPTEDIPKWQRLLVTNAVNADLLSKLTDLGSWQTRLGNLHFDFNLNPYFPTITFKH
ncbi:N-alpha-acetyltransferase 35, NatC auxiliary subunit [Pelomyxa schiedti]|nr:N-alpha-acetyltransferase 35, NatC auxiliary subunit [Pelomyxa schiedti]